MVGRFEMLTAKEGMALQFREILNMQERRLWSDKRYFAWFSERFGFSIKL